MEYKLEDYEQRIGKSRHIEVKIVCEVCGVEKWVRWTKRKNGQGRYCSLKCANIDQRLWGREHVYFYFAKERGRWMARWREKDTGKECVTHRARFLYENEYGEVPKDHEVHHIDLNKENDDLDNLELVQGKIHKKDIHGSNRKVENGTVYKQCFRCKKYYPVLEYTQSYCKECHKEYMREYRK
jgi:endogenous inhibitor of DNA gyrase (YacG/DUF329 family)